MNRGKRIVLTTFGSFGDIHPYMAIALELQARGHNSVIATSGLYREKIEGAGLSFAAIRLTFPLPGTRIRRRWTESWNQNLVRSI